MKTRSTILLGIIIAAWASAAAMAADAPDAACSLLTQADLDAATGAKSGAANPMNTDVPMGAGQHVTMNACLWPVSGVQGQVALSVAPIPPGQDARSLGKNNVGMEALRTDHYAEETKDFGNTTCSGMTPPASVTQGIGLFACTAVAHGKIVSVTFTSPTKKVPLDQMNALLDKAIARLH